MSTTIPTERTHPGLTEDEVNFLRLQWRADKSPLTSVVKCDHNPDDDHRYHVTINGREVRGHFHYDACWYLIVGAQMVDGSI